MAKRAIGGPVRRRRALVCVPSMPEFDRGGAPVRIHGFITILRKAGWEVTSVVLPGRSDDVSHLIQRARFDLALLASWHVGAFYLPLLRARSPHTKVIVDSIGLHFARDARRAFRRTAGDTRPGRFAASSTEIVRELNTYAAADAVLTVSATDATLLNAVLGDQANATAVPVARSTFLAVVRSVLSQHAVRPRLREANAPLDIEALRPGLVPVPAKLVKTGRGRAGHVLVIGVYLANQRNTVEDTVARLSESRRWRVHQKWIALGGSPPSAAVDDVTVKQIATPTPKFRLVNDLLARENLSRYEYVLLVDDDVVLPHAFVDQFLSWQRHCGFALAQPARTARSFIDHPIVEQQRGSLARQTLFVEIGPVVSFHRSIFHLVFPFDLTSPMGWGYENVWSARVTRRKRTMGIIDAVPVDHSVRPQVSNYRWDEADRGQTALWKKHAVPSTEECFRVLRVFTAGEMARA